jgi:hypothetical protein
MMILCGFGMLGSFRPVWRAQTRAFLVSVHGASGDVRRPIIALALHALAALEVFLQNQLASWARNVIGRAWQGARFAAEMTDADSTVAAGGSQGPALFREIGSLV